MFSLCFEGLQGWHIAAFVGSGFTEWANELTESAMDRKPETEQEPKLR